MSLALPKLRVGDPVRHETLSVFPLFSEPNSRIEYRLSDEALADESLLIEEISEGGSVPDLLVENKGDVRVLFLEGEELVGAKQNRILNTSVLVCASMLGERSTPLTVLAGATLFRISTKLCPGPTATSSTLSSGRIAARSSPIIRGLRSSGDNKPAYPRLKMLYARLIRSAGAKASIIPDSLVARPATTNAPPR